MFSHALPFPFPAVLSMDMMLLTNTRNSIVVEGGIVILSGKNVWQCGSWQVVTFCGNDAGWSRMLNSTSTTTLLLTSEQNNNNNPHRLDSLFCRKFFFMQKTLFVLIVYLSTQNKYIHLYITGMLGSLNIVFECPLERDIRCDDKMWSREWYRACIPFLGRMLSVDCLGININGRQWLRSRRDSPMLWYMGRGGEYKSLWTCNTFQDKILA